MRCVRAVAGAAVAADGLLKGPVHGVLPVASSALRPSWSVAASVAMTRWAMLRVAQLQG